MQNHGFLILDSKTEQLHAQGNYTAYSKVMRKPFLLVSGLPGSGKTTVGKQLASRLNLPLIDKDDILERLFEARGSGDTEARRALSRQSDSILQNEATASEGAVLVSFWHVLGMPSDSGTPTDWLRQPEYHVVNVRCTCDPGIAASRFLRRKRHSGHMDDGRTLDEVLANFEELARLGPLELGQSVEVDTSEEPQLEGVVHDIQKAIKSDTVE